MVLLADAGFLQQKFHGANLDFYEDFVERLIYSSPYCGDALMEVSRKVG